MIGLLPVPLTSTIVLNHEQNCAEANAANSLNYLVDQAKHEAP